MTCCASSSKRKSTRQTDLIGKGVRFAYPARHGSLLSGRGASSPHAMQTTNKCPDNGDAFSPQLPARTGGTLGAIFVVDAHRDDETRFVVRFGFAEIRAVAAIRKIILPQLEKLQIPSATSRSSFPLLGF